ncbi:isocitrate lyase/phosphoenolpyruvate mutase family protein [Mycobacterium sp. URHB0021]
MTASAFRALHQNRAAGDPLVLPGPWDVGSARALADSGYPALATPSIGIAASLGYQDGSTPPDEMFTAVARIVRAVSVPVSADIESGHGLAPRELVERLIETGAVGCNLEDSEHDELKDPVQHSDWLAEVREASGDAALSRSQVRRSPTLSWWRAQHSSAGMLSVELQALLRMGDSEVVDALEALPVEHRIVTFYADVEGWRYTEIAQITGWPLGTVMSRLHQGRRRQRWPLVDVARSRGNLRNAAKATITAA